jgi:hypothetical protein
MSYCNLKKSFWFTIHIWRRGDFSATLTANFVDKAVECRVIHTQAILGMYIQRATQNLASWWIKCFPKPMKIHDTNQIKFYSNSIHIWDGDIKSFILKKLFCIGKWICCYILTYRYVYFKQIRDLYFKQRDAGVMFKEEPCFKLHAVHHSILLARNQVSE